ncbi:MAG: hypothetical protein HYY97_07495 [Rhodocyclales bacterium]|nr:hypothetical protein [Rhodocyclales bacterium]
MTINKLALSLLLGAGLGAGCTTVPPSAHLATSDLPNCFDTNYDKERGIFTMRNEVAGAVNQQCLLIVHASNDAASASQLVAGRYTAYLANGGGGGAGGTLQGRPRIDGGKVGGGGGGGGAGAMETQTPVVLSPGTYKLTLGAGGPGGTACMPGAGFGGGPGWVGSPSNMIRVASGELVMGTAGADSYKRLSRSQNEKSAGKMDGHGGSGVGQTSGGDAAVAATGKTAMVAAEPGDAKLASGRTGAAGAAGSVSAGDKLSGAGGGGGATAVGSGGGGGGESPNQRELPPQRGTLGGGGGGGEGSRTECDPGARGGHGYIALRRI